MTTDISAPPFVLDVRVAVSPLVGLRYNVDGRATDINDLVARLQDAAAVTEAEREALLVRLAPYDAGHRLLVEQLARGPGEAQPARLEEGLELRTQLARLDERLRCLRERIDALGEQCEVLRRLRACLVQLDGLHDTSIEAPGASLNQAVRQIFHLIDLDHELAAQSILEGPMQLLADAALQTELIGRAVTEDPAAAAASAASCRRSADAALRELRRVVFALHPASLGDAGLVASLRRLVSDVAGDASARVVVLGPQRPLHHAVELALFRIAQEAVVNAVSHGRPATIEVVLLYQPARVAIVVLDDGEGFDLPATEARLGRAKGLGLISMRQRAEANGGHLEVRSVVGEGTEVRGTFALAS